MGSPEPISAGDAPSPGAGTAPTGEGGARPPLSASRKALFTAVLVLAPLLLVEGGMRIHYRIKEGHWGVPDRYQDRYETLYERHPYLGWVLRPNARYEKRSDETTKVIESNAYQLRDDEIVSPKPPGRIRIVCLGGSTTFDVGVTDNARTWPNRLEALARERRPELDVEVVNAGFPGYNTATSLINLSLRIVDLDPDLVVVYHGINDLTAAQIPEFRSDYAHGWAERFVGEPGPIRRALRSSILFAKIEHSMRRRRDRAAGRQDAGVEVTVPDEATETYRRNLRTIAGICQAHGIRLALGTFATARSQFEEPAPPGFACSYTPNLTPAELQRSLREWADVVRAVAAEQDAWLLDVQKKLPADPQLFDDFIHLNDEGARAMAAVVYDELEAAGAWETLAGR